MMRGLIAEMVVVVDAHALEVLVGQVGDHHVGHRHQLPHDLLAGRLHGIEREAELVAPHLEEHGAFAALGDRRHPAVLAAVELLDADHLGAEVAQHGAAERPRDVPAEIENANSARRTPGISSTPVMNAGLTATARPPQHRSIRSNPQSKKVLELRKTASNAAGLRRSTRRGGCRAVATHIAGAADAQRDRRAILRKHRSARSQTCSWWGRRAPGA